MTTITTASAVTAVAAAEPAAAAAHFAARLAVETDAADVRAAQAAGPQDFTVLDVRSAAAYAKGHLPRARHVPARSIDAAVASGLPDGLLVVYCWGPGCNAATKAAARLAGLGREVKEMIGGFEYWVREGHPVEGRGRYEADPG